VGKASRDKGGRIEREIVSRHTEIGVHAERVPLSGATNYRDNGADIDVYAFGRSAAPMICEIKARANGEGFAMLEKWLSDYDALFLRRNRSDPLVVVPWHIWAKIVKILSFRPEFG
jgi:Holliday junction resolvase